MSDAALTAAERRRSLAAVIATMLATALIYGLTTPLLSLVLNRLGTTESLIGLNTATQAFAVFFIAPFAPRIITRLGPAPTMIAAIAVGLVAFLALPLYPNVYVWFPLRFVIGAAHTFLWTAGEAWINQIAEERSRGRVVALYTAAISGGFALGPLILAHTGSEGWAPFLVAGAIIAASAVPLFFALKISPDLGGPQTASLPMFVILAPTAMLLNLVFSACDGALLAFLPIYGLRVGLGESSTLYLITLLGLGSIAAQPPIGWLADHMDRRLLIVVGVVLMVVAGAAIPFVVPHGPWNMAFMFAFGGVFGGLYSLSVVLLGERFKGADLAAAATVFSVMWGIGAVAGPPIGGAGLALFDPHGLPVVVALMFLAYLPFPVVSYLRYGRRRP